ncbi:MAG: Ig-like domain repeat protein [Bacilli bacterium]|nr:Ig-like domain repeat protein [Bacilli bacterium]
MKKKIWIFVIMFGLALFSEGVLVKAYSPDYLPGGVNYLDEEGFVSTDGIYGSSQPFLIKPYTNYTLTVPRAYGDEPWVVISFSYYENETLIDSQDITTEDMTFHDEGDQYYSYVFRTSSNCNYLGLAFADANGFFSLNGFDMFQLEEGVLYTGYVAYVEGALVDTSAPYFDSAGTVISYYDSPITATEIQSALTAYDAIDGDLSNNIIKVSDDYTPNMDFLGQYDIVFEVSDNAGNTTQITVHVQVVDVLAPVFSNLGSIRATYPNTYSVNDILSLLSASDNYDGNLSSEITLVSDNYTANSNFIGIYEMEFSVSDSSGNIGYYTQEIEVIDEEGPIISGIESVVIGYDSILSVEDVMSNISFTDNYDNQVDLELVLEENSYSQSPNQLGIYEMIFSVTDSSSNTNYHTVTIEVVDEMGPMVYFNSSVIRTYSDMVMSLPDFTSLLINANELDQTIDYFATVTYDSYTRNASVPGVYHITINFKSESGESLEKDLEIQVVERPVDYVRVGEQETAFEEPFLSRFQEILIGGIMSFLLVVSNVVWVILSRKK